MTRIERTALLLVLVLAGCAAPATSSQAGTEVTSTPSSTPAATRTSSPSESPPVSVRPGEPTYEVATYPVPPGSGPHDVAPAPDGGVWYTAQNSGELGWLDPETGDVLEVALGPGSRPHGVIVGPDGAPWVTDGGQNAIVRVDPKTSAVDVFPLPPSAPDANLNTAAFDGDGVLWFTGQAGWYGRLDPDGWYGRGVSRAARASARTASPPRRTARSTTARWPAATSARSIGRAARSGSSIRPPLVPACGGSGRTPRDASG